jgi:anti-sigma factor RsiW
MEPINSEELSAYLDGELDAHRAGQIKVAIENDGVTRNAYRIIVEDDSAWRAAAQSAQFQPKIALPSRTALGSAVAMGAALVFLLVIRALPKLSDALTLGLMLQGVALVAIMVWVILFARMTPELDEPKAA